MRGEKIKLADQMKRFFRWMRKAFTPEPASEIDREYIEGETADEIGEIGQMTEIPDKALRHPRPKKAA